MKTLQEFSALTIAATATSLALAFFLLLKVSSSKKRNYPPVAGTIFDQFRNLHRLLDFQTDLSRKYKTFRILTPLRNYVYTVDPANVEYMLKTHFTNFGKGDVNYDVMSDLLGDGIFAVDGEKWRHQRKVASYEFSLRVLRDYSSLVFRSKAVKLAELVSDAASSNQIIQIQDLFMKSTLDSIFKIGFGVDLDTLSGSNPEGMAFAKAFDDASNQVLRRYVDVFWKIKRSLNVGAEAQMKKNVKLMDDFVYKQIDSKVKQMSQQQNDAVKKEDILMRFLAEREKDPSSTDNKYLRDIVLNFVIAGRDTTSGTLGWLFYLLCKHPELQEKAALEVREVAGAEGLQVSDFVACLTEETVNGMQYLHAALSEALRLYPAVALDAKVCFSDDTFPDGFDLKKGDVVNYQPFPMGRMKFIWGENAEEFRPERWLDDAGVFVPENPFKFTAFQAGPRICLGKDFAYRQMKIFAATMLYFFKFKLTDEKKVINYRVSLTIQIDGGLWVNAMKRKTIFVPLGTSKLSKQIGVHPIKD